MQHIFLILSERISLPGGLIHTPAGKHSLVGLSSPCQFIQNKLYEGEQNTPFALEPTLCYATYFFLASLHDFKWHKTHFIRI